MSCSEELCTVLLAFVVGCGGRSGLDARRRAEAQTRLPRALWPPG